MKSLNYTSLKPAEYDSRPIVDIQKVIIFTFTLVTLVFSVSVEYLLGTKGLITNTGGIVGQ